MTLNLNTTPLFKEYFILQEKYEKLYGRNTVVLMEVGSFFEIYQIECDVIHEGKSKNINIGKSKEVADILNIQVTKKKKADQSTPKNPFMIGFPNYAVKKFINRLVNHNFTVVKYDQKDIPGSETKDRVLDKIYSPGTYIENEQPRSNYIIGILIDGENELTHGFLSAIDLSTGHVKLFSTHDTLENSDRAHNEIFRFIHTINPIEVLVANVESKDIRPSGTHLFGPLGRTNARKIIEEFKLDESLTHFRDIPADYRKISYQNALLKKVYGKTGELTPIEFIGLECQPDLLLVFILLLQFCYEHENSIIKRLSLPQIDTTDDTLILNKDSIYQLNIVSRDNRKFSSIFNLVNFTCTNMGRRLLKERLLVPITDIDVLNDRYDNIEKARDCYTKYTTILSEIMDLEKKHRKGLLKKLSPYELYSLHISYGKIEELINLGDSLISELVTDRTVKHFRKFCKEYKRIFNLESLQSIYTLNDLRRSVFNPGQFENIDNLQKKICECNEYFNNVREKYSRQIDPKNPIIVEILRNDKEGYYLKTTPTRFAKIKNDPEIIGKPIKNIAKFTTETFRQKSDECQALEEEIVSLVCKEFVGSVYKLFIGYRRTLNEIISFVSELDVICSSAKASVKYAYHRPVLERDASSSVSFKEIRHPLIERIIDKEYVTNDIEINRNGILLYGLNSVGKSSLLRSVGCNIVLAQAGLFVACEKMVLKPFSLLFSKITSTDNLFQGQSTFISEMAELRAILRGANSRSLILADELCSGTESLSATSIVASTLLELLKRETCFLFSTHLHTLANLKEISENERINIYHFAIEISEDGVPNYIRKLRNGQGETLYGLEIARTLGFGLSFMKTAFDIRAEMTGKEREILLPKKSKYNADLYVHNCEKCGKERGETSTFLETHHKNFQCNADKNGIIDGKFHKNNLHNLIVLCRECHTKVHTDRSDGKEGE